MWRKAWRQWFHHLFHDSSRRAGRKSPRRPPRTRPWLEILENRITPTTITAPDIADNTLFQEGGSDTGSQLSDGAGTTFFVGKLGTNGSGDLRRGAIKFDLSAVPAGSTITSATLTLTEGRAHNSSPENVSLFAAQMDWGEGTSVAFNGKGATATTNDATWYFSTFDTQTWNTPGGDFASSSSASTTIPAFSSGSFNWTGPGLVSDVQNWVNNPSTNFGWIVIGDENTSADIIEFDTKESGSSAPTLSVTYASAAAPTLAISKSHTGSFRQGDAADTYSVQVSNTGSGPTSGTVTVTDTLPTGLAPTAADNGTIGGWSVSASGQQITASRSDALAGGGSYPSLTVTVSVASNAPASVTNTAIVSGGGAASSASASDPTTITQVSDLTISKSHTGTFRQGDAADTYTLHISNTGSGSTSGTVTVTDTLPTGLAPTAADSGTIGGWTVSTSGQKITATRSDVLAGGGGYPNLTVTVSVASNAPASITNTASVAGGGELNTSNDSSSDPTTITQVADLAISVNHNGTFKEGDSADTYTVNVSNVGAGPTSGTVTVSDTLPTGLSPTAADSGTVNGWTLATSGQTITATRSDVLAAAGAYSALTITVSVASVAPTSVTNTVTVSGGGELNTSNDSASDTTPITIVATKLVIATSTTATAGTPFNFTVTAEDGGNNTATGFTGNVTLGSSAGGDISPTSVVLSSGTATIPLTLTTAGSQTITAAFTGLTSGTATIAVSPGALNKYHVTIPGSTTAGSGFLVSVQAEDQFNNPITSYSGPASVTASISPTSPGNFPASVSINSSGLGLFLGSIDLVGSYTVMVTGGSFSGSGGPITVSPGPAVRLTFVAQPVSTPTGVTLPPVKVQLVDPFGNLVSDSTHSVTLSVASGPAGAPGFTSASTTTQPLANGQAIFSNLTLIQPGSYALRELVPGVYTGPNSNTFSVAPLQVASGSFASSASGFSLSFNAPILVNATTPALYGTGFGATAPVPSVVLSQTKDATGNPITPVVIAGSVVLNTSTNSLTFVATDTGALGTTTPPILQDGTYVARLRSKGTTGFQASNNGGGFLDGLNSGTPGSGDFLATFTVGAAAAGDDVVWVPATADGPGQALVAPGQNLAGGGYPLYLDDSTGTVTNVQVTLNYNAALLTVSGVTGANFTLLAASTPGHAVLQYSGPALAKGNQTPIGFVTASVYGGTSASPAPYKAKDLLHLSALALNGGAINVVGGDALHLMSYVGDVDGNATYSSNDAVLITRVALQTDTGFAAYPLVDPTIVADTDGAGFIPADAALQINEAGVGFQTSTLANPPIPSGTVIQLGGNGQEPIHQLARVASHTASQVATTSPLIQQGNGGGQSFVFGGINGFSFDLSSVRGGTGGQTVTAAGNHQATTGSSVPTLTVSMPAVLPAGQTKTITVTGGAESNAVNDSSGDFTASLLAPDLTPFEPDRIAGQL